MRTHWAARLVSNAAFVATIVLTASSCADETSGPSQPTVGSPENVILAAASNTWAAKKPLPSARVQLVAGSVSNIVYVIGGTTGTLTPLRTVQAYNPTTNSWTGKAQLPAGRRGLIGAANISGKLKAGNIQSHRVR